MSLKCLLHAPGMPCLRPTKHTFTHMCCAAVAQDEFIAQEVASTKKMAEYWKQEAERLAALAAAHLQKDEQLQTLAVRGKAPRSCSAGLGLPVAINATANVSEHCNVAVSAICILPDGTQWELASAILLLLLSISSAYPHCFMGPLLLEGAVIIC